MVRAELFPPAAHRRFLGPRDGLSAAPAAAAPPCPPRERSHSGRVAPRTRRDRRLPPLANTDRRRFCRHCPPTSSTLKSQIPTGTGSRRRQPSSGGLRPATPTVRPVKVPASLGCKRPAAPACRAVPAPVPRGRGVTLYAASVTDSTCWRPPSAASSVSQSGCSSAIRAGSSRLCREGILPKLSMDVNRTVGPPRPACAPRGRSPWCVPASDRGRHFRPARSSRDHFPCLQDRVGFLPEIPRQRESVPALMAPCRPHPLPNFELPASPRTGPSRPLTG